MDSGFARGLEIRKGEIIDETSLEQTQRTRKIHLPTCHNQEQNKLKTFFLTIPGFASLSEYLPGLSLGPFLSVGDSQIILAPGPFYLHNRSLGKFLHFSTETLALSRTSY